MPPEPIIQYNVRWDPLRDPSLVTRLGTTLRVRAELVAIRLQLAPGVHYLWIGCLGLGQENDSLVGRNRDGAAVRIQLPKRPPFPASQFPVSSTVGAVRALDGTEPGARLAAGTCRNVTICVTAAAQYGILTAQYGKIAARNGNLVAKQSKPHTPKGIGA